MGPFFSPKLVNNSGSRFMLFLQGVLQACFAVVTEQVTPTKNRHRPEGR